LPSLFAEVELAVDYNVVSYVSCSSMKESLTSIRVLSHRAPISKPQNTEFVIGF
jgi:hypothetical protein